MSKAKSLALYDAHVGRAIAVLAGVCALSAFLYGAFLLEAVAHAAHESTVRKEVAARTAQTALLEQEYLALTKSLTPERAVALGYTAPVRTTIVYVQTSALSVNAGR